MAILKGPAQAVTPYEVASLSEEEARALFCRLRFAENGGEPFCPHCGCVGVSPIRTRLIWKCKACTQQFSPTSKTAFAYRKLSFKLIMSIMAEINIAYQGRSALEIKRNLTHIKNYKTIFVWLHKLRCAMKRAGEKIILQGEVGIDGTEVGGYLRPSNQREDASGRKNAYFYPEKDKATKMTVTFARERDGPTRSWVGHQEYHAVTEFVKAIRSGATTIFTDGGPGWSRIRAEAPSLPHRRVNHRQNFWTPSACTNLPESGFRCLAGMEMIFRHITSSYLDFYAAQCAWRLTRVRISDAEGLAAMMQAMTSTGRSEMAGYFLKRKHGGEKRACGIVGEDGRPTQWRPMPQAEKRRRREAARQRAGRPNNPSLKEARSKRSFKEGFTFVSATDLIHDPSKVPNEPGVYTLFLRDGRRLVEAGGLIHGSSLPCWETEEAGFHVYTGQSYAVRDRLLSHVANSDDSSTFRESLLATQWFTGLKPDHLPDFSSRNTVEAGLTAWLSGQLVVGYKIMHYIKQVERAILANTASPFNIADREPTSTTRLLTNMRQRFRENVTFAWAPPPPRERFKRRR